MTPICQENPLLLVLSIITTFPRRKRVVAVLRVARIAPSRVRRGQGLSEVFAIKICSWRKGNRNILSCFHYRWVFFNTLSVSSSPCGIWQPFLLQLRRIWRGTGGEANAPFLPRAKIGSAEKRIGEDGGLWSAFPWHALLWLVTCQELQDPVIFNCCFQCHPNHQRWHPKWKLSRNMCTCCMHVFCTLGADLHAQSALANKISASELSRKFIMSALLVGHGKAF